jgi:hypothetical protein
LRAIAKRVGQAAIATGIAITATAMTATPAQAAQQNAYASLTKTTTMLGDAWFMANGEDVLLFDTDADGKGVAFELQRADANSRWSLYASGYSSFGATGRAKRFDLSLPEGTVVRLRVCVWAAGGGRTPCGAWGYGTA